MIVRMRKRTHHSSTFLWMGLASMGLLVLFTLASANAQVAQEDETESPSASASAAIPTTIRQETGTETTESSNYPYQYDDTEELESVTDDETLIPTTTLKAARNFGNRIRGINSLPNNANSVNSLASSSTNRNLNQTLNANLNINSNSNNVTSFPFLRPRPTTSSVISYNPTQYNRVMKRRKNSTVSSLSTLSTAATFTTPSLLTYLSAVRNNKSSTGSNNISSISSNSLNRRSEAEPNEAVTTVLSSIPSPTLPTTSSQQIRQNLAAGRSNGSSSNSLNLLNKLYIRKRPRPITLSDGRGGGDDSSETTPPPTTTIITPAGEEDNTSGSVDDGDEATSTLPPLHVKYRGRPAFQGTTGRPMLFGNRRIKVKLVSPTSVSVPVPTPPAESASPPSPMAAAASDEIATSVRSLLAQPVSHVPVSSLSFEYNPSVSVQDGIYKFRYSDIKPTLSSRRVYSEDFGVSHVTYGHDHDENDATTTYPPPQAPLEDDETTQNPYNIDIDGSEEEFTSSLPPSYREFFDDEDRLEGEQQMKKPFLRNAADENNNNDQPRDRPADQVQGQGQILGSSVTVTVTHTITAGGGGDALVKPTRSHQNPIENKLAFSHPSNYTGSVTDQSQNRNYNRNNIVQQQRESGVRDGNSLPNTIPIVVEQFNSSNAINEQQLQRQEQVNEGNAIQATPALPPVPTQSSTWMKTNETSPSFVEVNNEINKNVLAVASGPAVVVETPGNKSESSDVLSPLPADAGVIPAVPTTITTTTIGADSSNNNNDKLLEQQQQGQGRHQIQNASSELEPTHSTAPEEKVSVLSPKISESDILNPAVEITPTVSSKMMTSVFYTKHEDPFYTTSSYSYASSTEYSFGVQPPHGHGQHSHDDDHSHFDHEHDADSEHGHEVDHEAPYGHGQGHPHSNDSQYPTDNAQKQQELRPTTTSFWDSLGHKSVDGASKLNTNDSSRIPPGQDQAEHDQELSFSTPEVDTEFPPLSLGDIGRTTPMPESNSPDHSEADNEIDDGHLHDSTVHHHDNHNHSHSNSNNDGSNGNESDGVVLSHPNYPRRNRTFEKKQSEGNDIHPDFPTVPVFIQVLLDMPALVFCTSVPLFKEMVVKVYAAKQEVTKDQVVVFNEPKCNNLTWDSKANVNNQSFQQQSGKIKYATTTASVTRTISSTARSVLNQRRQSSSYNPIVIGETTPSSSPSSPPVDIELGPSLTKPTITTGISRRKRHDQDPPHSSDENSIQKKTFDGTSPTEFSETIKLYPVFFYLTDKNGTYNQYLTESFIEFWNISKATSNTMFFDKIKRVEKMTPTQGQGITGHAADNENSGIIAAITIAAIAAVCLFLLGVLLLVMRHRQKQSKFAKRCTPVSLDDYSLDNISVYNSFRRKQRKRTSTRSYTNAAFDDPNAPSRPCNAAALTAIISEVVKIEEEFRALPSVNPTMDDIPAGAETKNRYANVIPMPDTRVFVTFQEDTPNSDYINANFVRGPMGTSKGYIITQGPLEETIVDFWRMVWEQQIRVIMMLTDFSEAGIPKCAEYYPRSETVDSSQLHGDFQITLEKRDITENCITSYLVIKDMERNLRRDVIHLWYHSWPEKGVPVQPNVTVDFLTKSRKFTKEPTPVLVHCSPGTGRSGTLVACDVAMREFDTQHKVNIPRTVMKIRQDRAGAVQTKEQYLHIYQVVQYYASRLSGIPADSI